MANIVELRDMNNEKLEEMLENAREELFNLRFQQASARLEDYSRLKYVRREIAQLETALNNRQQAIEIAASGSSELATFLSDKNWMATARYVYEDAAWRVDFSDESGGDIATALVNLNKKKSRGRKARQHDLPPDLVTHFEITE